jgi:hypothetical protein
MGEVAESFDWICGKFLKHPLLYPGKVLHILMTARERKKPDKSSI